MTRARLARSLDAAILPVVNTLRPWGVTDGHCFPGYDGAAVVWLRTDTEAQRADLEEQPWVFTWLQVALAQRCLPHDIAWLLRLEITSQEGEDRLYAENGIA
jgi:hypothetical protein